MGHTGLSRRLSGFVYQDWLLLCFILGILGGTAAVLVFGNGLILTGVLGGTSGGNAPEAAFFRVFRKRASQVSMGWLAGLTVCSRFLFGVFTFGAGLCLGTVLAVLTARRGLMGLPLFLQSALPHGMIYLGVWYILAGWAGQEEKKVHLLGWGLLVLAVGVGAWME